jgi:hypothetical protein
MVSVIPHLWLDGQAAEDAQLYVRSFPTRGSSRHTTTRTPGRTSRSEAKGFFALIDTPEHWEAPTASGWWQVREVVGHQVDTTDGYLVRFDAARNEADPGALAALPNMAPTAGSRAQEFRQTPREELTRD